MGDQDPANISLGASTRSTAAYTQDDQCTSKSADMSGRTTPPKRRVLGIPRSSMVPSKRVFSPTMEPTAPKSFTQAIRMPPNFDAKAQLGTSAGTMKTRMPTLQPQLGPVVPNRAIPPSHSTLPIHLQKPVQKQRPVSTMPMRSDAQTSQQSVYVQQPTKFVHDVQRSMTTLPKHDQLPTSNFMSRYLPQRQTNFLSTSTGQPGPSAVDSQMRTVSKLTPEAVSGLQRQVRIPPALLPVQRQVPKQLMPTHSRLVHQGEQLPRNVALGTSKSVAVSIQPKDPNQKPLVRMVPREKLNLNKPLIPTYQHHQVPQKKLMVSIVDERDKTKKPIVVYLDQQHIKPAPKQYINPNLFPASHIPAVEGEEIVLAEGGDQVFDNIGAEEVIESSHRPITSIMEQQFGQPRYHVKTVHPGFARPSASYGVTSQQPEPSTSSSDNRAPAIRTAVAARTLIDVAKMQSPHNPTTQHLQMQQIVNAKYPVAVLKKKMKRDKINKNKKSYTMSAYDLEQQEKFSQLNVLRTKARVPPVLCAEPPQAMANWQRDQKRKMDILEVMDGLPMGLHEKYRKLFRKRHVFFTNEKRPRSHYLKQNYRKNGSNRGRAQSAITGNGGIIPREKPGPSGKRVQLALQNKFVGQVREILLKKHREGKLDPKLVHAIEMNQLGGPGITLRAQLPSKTMYEIDQLDGKRTDSTLRFCSGCKMELRRSVYYHHARMIRDHGACNLFTPQRFPCTLCKEKLGTLEKLCVHLDQRHGAPTRIKSIIFDTEDDFQKFRVELEGKGGNFRMARGNKRNKKGIVQYFRCNRTQTITKERKEDDVESKAGSTKGKRRPGELAERPFGVKQVIRTEQSCTAFFIKAFLPDGRIEVRYCDYHLHDDERLRLPEPVRERILGMSRKGLPHAVMLLVVKKEMHLYAKPNSANERRILDIKAQDVRQILAAYNRQERTARMRKRNKEARLKGIGPNKLVPKEAEILEKETDNERDKDDDDEDEDEELTEIEKDCLKEFEENREMILSEMTHREKTDSEKRIVFESFRDHIIHIQRFLKNYDANPDPQEEEIWLGLKSQIEKMHYALEKSHKGGDISKIDVRHVKDGNKANRNVDENLILRADEVPEAVVDVTVDTAEVIEGDLVKPSSATPANVEQGEGKSKKLYREMMEADSEKKKLASKRKHAKKNEQKTASLVKKDNDDENKEDEDATEPAPKKARGKKQPRFVPRTGPLIHTSSSPTKTRGRKRKIVSENVESDTILPKASEGQQESDDPASATHQAMPSTKPTRVQFAPGKLAAALAATEARRAAENASELQAEAATQETKSDDSNTMGTQDVSEQTMPLASPSSHTFEEGDGDDVLVTSSKQSSPKKLRRHAADEESPAQARTPKKLKVAPSSSPLDEQVAEDVEQDQRRSRKGRVIKPKSFFG